MTIHREPAVTEQHPPQPPSATAYGHRALGLLEVAAAGTLSAVKAMLAHTSHTPVSKRHLPTGSSPSSHSNRPLSLG